MASQRVNRLATAVRCSSLCRIATPCQDLACKDGIDSEKIPTLQHGSPTRGKKSDWKAWVRTQTVDCHDNLIRSETIYSDMVFTRRRWDIASVSSSNVSTFLSSSYRLQKFADTDCLRVNRRTIRKEIFPDRYGFVPIVFTSSSCKRGLSVCAMGGLPQVWWEWMIISK